MNTLTLDQLRKLVPAAFAEEPADKVSDRYSFIPTVPIIDALASRGWQPVSARQSRRVRDSRHALHMIDFQPTGTFNLAEVGDVTPQICLFNSHDTSRRFCLRGGIFRKVCSNGLVISIGIGDSQMLRIHIDGASVDIEVAFETTLKQLGEAAELVPQWQRTQLNFVQQLDFATEAVNIRNNNDPWWSKHFDAHEFLTRRRDEDKQNDLWSVFNVVQENVIKGGVRGAVRETRPITQVKEIQRINESLWRLATQYGVLHGAN